MGAGNMGGAAGRDLSRRMREQQGDGRDPQAMGGFGNSPLRQEERRPAAGVQNMRDMFGGGRGPFQFGGDNEMGGMGAPDPAFGVEKRDADLSTPEGDAPDPDALRAVAGSRRERQRNRANERQRKFFERMPKGGKGTFSETETVNGETQSRSGSFDPSQGSPFKLGKGMDMSSGRRGVMFGEQMPGDGAGAPEGNMQPDMGPDQPFDFAAMMGGPKQQYEEQVQSRSPIPGQSLQAGQQAAQIRASLTERRGAAAKRRMPTMDDEYLSL